MIKKYRLYALLIMLIAVVLGYMASTGSGPFNRKPKFEFQKGMCYVTWSKDSYSTNNSRESIKVVKNIGTTWVAIIPTWYQDNCSSSKIYSVQKNRNGFQFNRRNIYRCSPIFCIPDIFLFPISRLIILPSAFFYFAQAD